jgi:SAM-dependent methyltransferase
MPQTPGVAEQSKLMSLFRALRLEPLAWSARRLHCPIGNDALVLEVGAGSNPYPRANVLLDAYEESQERHWQPLRKDRPFVFGFIENLPFRDGAFDFLIASHVLEHSRNPEKAVAEFQRVAKAGYIEVPDALFERLMPYKDHRLEITAREGRLLIRKKAAWLVDSELNDFVRNNGGVVGGKLVSRHPFAFHVRYYWQGHIDYLVVNPEVDNGWSAEAAERPAPSHSWRQTARTSYLNLLNAMFAQKARNARINILDLLRCPSCRSVRLSTKDDGILCQDCRTTYARLHGFPVLNARPLPTSYREATS